MSDLLSSQGNVKALFLKINTASDVISFVGVSGYKMLWEMYIRANGLSGDCAIPCVINPFFKNFVVGYLLGASDGETVGRIKALQQSEAIINDVFDKIEQQ